MLGITFNYVELVEANLLQNLSSTLITRAEFRVKNNLYFRFLEKRGKRLVCLLTHIGNFSFRKPIKKTKVKTILKISGIRLSDSTFNDKSFYILNHFHRRMELKVLTNIFKK